MNGFTFIAFIIVCWYVIHLAIKCFEIAAHSIAREQGKRKGLEHRSLMMRAEKNGEWSANNEWC